MSYYSNGNVFKIETIEAAETKSAWKLVDNFAKEAPFDILASTRLLV